MVIPAAGARVEGCICGGLAFHRRDCPISALPYAEQSAAIDKALGRQPGDVPDWAELMELTKAEPARRPPWQRRKRAESMPARFEPLAIYNAECGRGIMHTPEYDAAMVVLEREYDAWQNGTMAQAGDAVITCTRHGVSDCPCLTAPATFSATRPPGGYPAGTISR
jgi:hypothetical protein